jgi:3',5'-nucleoside bisphosphate phosphatase
MEYADLHAHTHFSDGTCSPHELIALSKSARLACISVCDHDTVDGIEPTRSAGCKAGVELMAGIELSAEYNGLEIHILGYCIDETDEQLRQHLVALRRNRIERVYQMSAKLNDLGIHLNPESVFALAKNGSVGRLHVARALVKSGNVMSTGEAFQKYIGDQGPAYVCGFKFTPQQAIQVIRKAGGVPVLAHPYLIRDDSLIPRFIDDGIMGLEVYYPEHTQSMINYFNELAQRHNLLVTGGSDFHGTAKPDVNIGTVRIPYELVERIKERCHR